MASIPKVVIVGRSNVGKSTLFNRLVGKRRAITSRVSGTTRDRVAALVSWKSRDFMLVDTAGLLSYEDSSELIKSAAEKKTLEVLEGSDLILFVIDGKSGLTAEDEEVARLLRKYSKKVILVANKLDTFEAEKRNQFGGLGFSDYFGVSAITGRRCADLLSKIAERLPVFKNNKRDEKVLAIIGRPNVGKSTLFNALVGESISIVSDVPGTTRDSIQATFSRNGRSFLIYDTAGYRRRGKINIGVEKFSIFRVLDAIETADLILVVIDGSEGITRQDAHLVQLALDQNKGVIVVVNKIDKIKNESTLNIKDFYRYPFILKQKIIGVSAINKKNIYLLASEIEKELFT